METEESVSSKISVKDVVKAKLASKSSLMGDLESEDESDTDQAQKVKDVYASLAQTPLFPHFEHILKTATGGDKQAAAESSGSSSSGEDSSDEEEDEEGEEKTEAKVVQKPVDKPHGDAMVLSDIKAKERPEGDQSSKKKKKQSPGEQEKKEKKKEKKEKRKAKELARSESSSDKKRSREEGEETEQKKKAKKDVVPFDYSAAAPELTPLTAMGGTSVELPNSNKPKKMQPAKPRPSAYEAPTVESFAPESLPNSKKIKSKAHMLSGNKSYSFLE